MKKNSLPRKSILYFLKRLFMSIGAGIIVGSLVWFVFPQQHVSLPCANSISCAKDLSFHIDKNSQGTFEGQKVLAPSVDLAAVSSKTAVLGASTAPGEKHIYVDLTTQTLYAYQGKALVLKTLISSGKWHPTPTGDFTIWIKLRATRMTGGEGEDYYDLPNVPYVMFFSNNEVPQYLGFSLHGAYWHNNFGHPMSHGCVNMRIVDAHALYDWVDPPTDGLTTYATVDHPGTQVTITGNAPGE